jgi:multidrug resistance efflux pump
MSPAEIRAALRAAEAALKAASADVAAAEAALRLIGPDDLERASALREMRRAAVAREAEARAEVEDLTFQLLA